MIVWRTLNIKKSLIREMYERADENCIDLSIGVPYLNTPDSVKETAISAINKNKTFYTENRGLAELRNSIAEKFNKNHRKKIDGNGITVHVGSTEALFSTMFSMIMPGDSVLIPDPGYPAYESIAKLIGANTVMYQSTLRDSESEYKSIKEKYNKDVKVIIVNSPSNPTGHIIPKNEMEKIAVFLKKKGIFAISDEVYSDLVYTENFTSISDFLPIDKCAVISGVSKSYGMTGWRIGWSISSEANSQEFNKSHMYTVSCASSISQYASIEALKNEKYEYYALSAMEKNREMALYELNKLSNIRIIPPDGAIFLFIDVSQIGNGKEIAFALLEKEKIITVPGIGFGQRGNNYIRISFGVNPEILKEGLKRMNNFFRKS